MAADGRITGNSTWSRRFWLDGKKIEVALGIAARKQKIARQFTLIGE
jgi:hypothetical protein